MTADQQAPMALTIVGPGRVGNSIAHAASGDGIDVLLTGRDFTGDQIAGRTVLLCVPDAAIEAVATRIRESGPADGLPAFLGHTSGATTLDPLRDAQTDGAFSLHPLQTVPDGNTDLRACPAAVSGSGEAATATATRLAGLLGMQAFEIPEADRATYHAAASIASNFLVTLEQSAAGLLDGIGVDDPRAVLAPLVRRSLANWEERGAAALTGPISRGDTETVERHRAALRLRNPEILPLYDAMAERTRAMVTS